MPTFHVKSVKIHTGQKKLHGYIRGIRDKYEVWGGLGMSKYDESLVGQLTRPFTPPTPIYYN